MRGGGAPDAPAVRVNLPPAPPSSPAAPTPTRFPPPDAAAGEEEEEPNEAPPRAYAYAADDEAFIALEAVAAHGDDLFGEGVRLPAPRKADPPPAGLADPATQRVLFLSAWVLTTMGATLAAPPQRHSPS